MVVRAAGDKNEPSTDLDTDCVSLKSCLAFCRAITVRSDVCVLHTPRKTRSCFGRRTASSREPAVVELYTTTNTPRLSSNFIIRSAKSLFLERWRSANAQTASVITLICTGSDGSDRLASRVLGNLRNESIESTLLPQSTYNYGRLVVQRRTTEAADDCASVSCVVRSSDTLHAMNLLHDRFCL